MVGIVIGVLICIEVRQVCQNAEVGIIENLIRVHPIDVWHGVAFRSRLQLGPVFAPACDLYVNDYIGMLGCVGVTHRLHTVALEDVPDLEAQVGFAICGAAASGD